MSPWIFHQTAYASPHTVSVPVLGRAPTTVTKRCTPSNQPNTHIDKYTLLPKINTVTWKSQANDLADKLEYGGAKTILVATRDAQ